MKIYLASRYSRREELCRYRETLESSGEHRITSRWLNGDHLASESDMLGEQSPESDRVRFALEDWHDLTEAECCISFTEEPRGTNSRGGRHVEFGAALAFFQTCFVVGPRENIFHCLPQVNHFDTWESFLETFAAWTWRNGVPVVRPGGVVMSWEVTE